MEFRQEAGRYLDDRQRRLGRLASEDQRDLRFLARALPGWPTASTRRYKYWWGNGWWGDQGFTSQCVAYSGVHVLEDSRITYPASGPVLVPEVLYNEAQLVDEWPGEGYDGTSVRAGAKVIQARGYVQEYRWAFMIDDLVLALLEVGPVWFGTNWYDGMFDPDLSRNGLLSLTGGVVGGHAYVLNGINLDSGMVRVKNSWGRGWGINGLARIRLDDVERLLDEQGEACMLIEQRPA